MDSRNGQTCKHASSQNKRDSNAQKQPELRVVGILGKVLVGVLEHVDDAAKRHGQRRYHGRKGVKEADEGEASSAQRRAIGARTSGAHDHGHGYKTQALACREMKMDSEERGSATNWPENEVVVCATQIMTEAAVW